jgi:hypothetical protein
MKTLKKRAGFLPCDVPKKVEVFRNRLTLWWNDRDWQLVPKRGIVLKEDPRDHHPIIYNLMQQGMTLSEALTFYCWGSNSRFGIPEYRHIMDHLKNVDTDIKNFRPKLIKRLGNDYYKLGNILQPKYWQLFIFQYYINDPSYRVMNDMQNPKRELHYRWLSYLDLFSSQETVDSPFFDFDILGSSHDEDLDARATLVAERCEEDKNISAIYTIDGHGRFVKRLVKSLMNVSDGEFFFLRPKCKILVYDIDEETHYWHQLTMPVGCAMKGDIFDVLFESIKNGSIKNKIFYLNLSGLMGQGNKILKAYKELLNTPHFKNLIVSFASTQNGREPAQKLLEDFDNFNDKSPRKVERKTARSFKNNKFINSELLSKEMGEFITVASVE